MYSGHRALILRDKTAELCRTHSLQSDYRVEQAPTEQLALAIVLVQFSLGGLRGWIAKEWKRQGSFQMLFLYMKKKLSSHCSYEEGGGLEPA